MILDTDIIMRSRKSCECKSIFQTAHRTTTTENVRGCAALRVQTGRAGWGSGFPAAPGPFDPNRKRLVNREQQTIIRHETVSTSTWLHVWISLQEEEQLILCRCCRLSSTLEAIIFYVIVSGVWSKIWSLSWLVVAAWLQV